MVKVEVNKWLVETIQARLVEIWESRCEEDDVDHGGYHYESFHMANSLLDEWEAHGIAEEFEYESYKEARAYWKK